MTHAPIIGLNCELKEAKGRTNSAIDQDYYLSVEEAGGLPLLVPPVRSEENQEQILELVDGLIFIGGRDLSPARYGQEPGPEHKPLNPVRERFDRGLAREALERDIPSLWVCLGIQLLNVVLGGDLVQDIPSQVPKALAHTADYPGPNHGIEISRDSLLGEILKGAEIEIASSHHQAVGKLGAGLVPTSHAPDGVIEAIEGPAYRFVLGVQFHPERLPNEVRSRIFRSLVKAASQYRRETKS